MSRIDELIAELCPEGVEFKELRNVAGYSSTRVDSSDLDETTFVGVDNLLPNMAGKTNATYTANTARLTAYEIGDILLGNIRPYLKKIWLADDNGGCSGDVLAIRIAEEHRPELMPEFLYRLLASDDFFAYNMQHAKGAKMPRGSKEAILRYRIPIPPLKIQREIVKVLDTFTQLEAELEAELEARRRQYQYYRDALLALPEAPRMLIGDLFDFKNGLNKGKEFFGKGSPIVNFVDVFKNRALTESMIHGRVEVTPKEQGLYSAKRNDVFFTRTSETREEIGMASVLLDAIEDCVFSGFVLRARPKTELLLPKFCAYILSSHDVRKEIVRNSSYTTRALTNGGVLSRLTIPIPPLEEQQRIVAILDKFDALVNDRSSGLPAEIRARRQQYENYRDRLLSFREAE